MDSFGSNKARKLVLPRNRRWWWWCIQQHPWTVSAETTSPHIGGAILINLVSYWYVTFKLLFWKRTFIASRIHNTSFYSFFPFLHSFCKIILYIRVFKEKICARYLGQHFPVWAGHTLLLLFSPVLSFFRHHSLSQQRRPFIDSSDAHHQYLSIVTAHLIDGKVHISYSTWIILQCSRKK